MFERTPEKRRAGGDGRLVESRPAVGALLVHLRDAAVTRRTEVEIARRVAHVPVYHGRAYHSFAGRDGA